MADIVTKKYFLALFVLLSVTTPGHLSIFNVIYSWTHIDFLWISKQHKEEAINSGRYNPLNVVPYDMDIAQDGRVFITTVRDVGVPATLSTISKKVGDGGPLLMPYPDWTWHEGNNCEGITSVYRVAIDCNILWVLDNGQIGNDQVCPPQVLAFNLSSDSLIKRIDVSPSATGNASKTELLVNILVEHPTPNNLKIYISDVLGYTLVTYNNGVVKRYTSYSFDGDPNFFNYTLRGDSFYLDDGILPMALKRGINSVLYWRPLASNALYSASTKDINSSEKSRLSDSAISAVNNIPYRSAAMVMTKRGYLIFSELENDAISAWKPSKPYATKRVIERNKETLQFCTSIKAIGHRWQNLWLITNRLQRFITGNQNLNETNFRIMTAPVNKALRCSKQSRNGT